MCTASESWKPKTDSTMEDWWIKIFPYRMLEWEWYDDLYMFRLFMHLLFKANNRDKEWHGTIIKRGQLVTSLANLSAKTGLSYQQVRSCLDKLNKTGEINKQTTNKFTIITVCKYGKYQQSPVDEQQAINKQTTIKQQSNNNQITTTIEYKSKRDIDISSTDVEDAAPTRVEIDFVAVKEFFNRTMENASIPKIRTKIDGRRKEMLTARVREYGIDMVYEVITKAAASSFLNGGGNRGFVADFEWLMRPNNFPKVLEGNYDNHETTNQTQPTGDPRQQERANLARDYAATISRRLAEDDARTEALRKP